MFWNFAKKTDVWYTVHNIPYSQTHMKNSVLHKHVSKTTACTSVLVLLFFVSFAVVLPVVKVLNDAPVAYARELRTQAKMDLDNDGINDPFDSSPRGSRISSVAFGPDDVNPALETEV